MGLTIHLGLRSRAHSRDAAYAQVQLMRAEAKKFGFVKIGPIRELVGKQCERNTYKTKRQRQSAASGLLFSASQSVPCPWNKSRVSFHVEPKHVIAFSINVGPGSEWLTLGLAEYPETIVRKYEPGYDLRFMRHDEHSWSYEVDWDKWKRWRKRHRPDAPYFQPSELEEDRIIPTELSGWMWRDFCKTQYASNPDCGGPANFLRCHISVISLLLRVGGIPGLRVDISDEGEYGPYTSCPDWREADAAGRKRKYLKFSGNFSPQKLLQEVGEWNSMMAAMVGAMKDVVGGNLLDAPILGFRNFEQLEFSGHKQTELQPFLQGLAPIAEAARLEFQKSQEKPKCSKRRTKR